MKSKAKLITVERLKRGKNIYYEQSIVSNGIDFITVKYEDNGGGFSHTFNKTMSKEFFRKLKQQNQ